jgi:hypothetical protein
VCRATHHARGTATQRLYISSAPPHRRRLSGNTQAAAEGPKAQLEKGQHASDTPKPGCSLSVHHMGPVDGTNSKQCVLHPSPGRANTHSAPCTDRLVLKKYFIHTCRGAGEGTGLPGTLYCEPSSAKTRGWLSQGYCVPSLPKTQTPGSLLPGPLPNFSSSYIELALMLLYKTALHMWHTGGMRHHLFFQLQPCSMQMSDKTCAMQTQTQLQQLQPRWCADASDNIPSAAAIHSPLLTPMHSCTNHACPNWVCVGGR